MAVLTICPTLSLAMRATRQFRCDFRILGPMVIVRPRRLALQISAAYFLTTTLLISRVRLSMRGPDRLIKQEASSVRSASYYLPHELYFCTCTRCEQNAGAALRLRRTSFYSTSKSRRFFRKRNTLFRLLHDVSTAVTSSA